MVRNMQEAWGKNASAWRARISGILEKGDPTEVYEAYKSYGLYIDTEMRRSK